MDKKKELFEVVFNHVENIYKYMKDSCDNAQERVIEAEGAMISRYDTMKEEGQYLVTSLIKRINEIKIGRDILISINKNKKFEKHDKVQQFSFVKISFKVKNADTEDFKNFLVLDGLGGEQIGEWVVISRKSPIGEKIYNQELYYEFEHEIEHKKLNIEKYECEIVDVF